MAITINGSGTITGISAGGLPDGSVTAADIESSLDLSGKTVTLPSGTGGKVLQVVSTTKTDTFSASLSSGAETDITGYSASITPSSTTSKVLVLVSAHMHNGTEGGGGLTIHRNGSIILPSDSSGSQGRISAHSIGVNNSEISDSVHFTGLDSPNSTSAQTYQVRMHNIATGTRTMYLNRGTSSSVRYYTSSTITVMEIGA